MTVSQPQCRPYEQLSALCRVLQSYFVVVILVATQYPYAATSIFRLKYV